MHGDLLCIDDHAYQRLRRIVRNPIVQFVMRRLTLRQRQKLAERMREGSKEHIESMDVAAPQIMDVNQDEVRRTFERYGVDCIIHGHTHRPAVHEMQIDGHSRPCASCSAIGTSKAACCGGTSADLGWRSCQATSPEPTGGPEWNRSCGSGDVASSASISAKCLSRARQSCCTGTVLRESHIHRVVACFRCRQSAVELAERSLQPRRQTDETLVRTRLDQRAAQKQIDQPSGIRATRRRAQPVGITRWRLAARTARRAPASSSALARNAAAPRAQGATSDR